MVFSLTSKKKKTSKIPKANSKLRVHTNAQRNVTVTNNVILSPHQSQNLPDPYQQLSSNRAIFETNKLESACSFLKCLKHKLERDVDEDKGNYLFENSTSETITDILDTLIDVSDNITPIISDASASTKSIYRSTMSDSSSVSEKHFNRTMTATNKLLGFAKKPFGKPSNMADASYYFAHKIIANNFEELTMFKNNIKNVGDKIYVDKKLLSQLVELHGLLMDTITKLKDQEDKILTDPKWKAELDKSGYYETATNLEETPKPYQKPHTSTPISKTPPPFQPPDDTDTTNETDLQYLTAASAPVSKSKRKSAKNKVKEDPQLPQGHPVVLSTFPINSEAENPSFRYETAREIPDRSLVQSSIYAAARQTPTRLSPEPSSFATAYGTPEKNSVQPSTYATPYQTSTSIETSSYVTAHATPEKSSVERSMYTTPRQTATMVSSEPSSYVTARATSEKTYVDPSTYATPCQTPTRISLEPSSHATAGETPGKSLYTTCQTPTRMSPEPSSYGTTREIPLKGSPQPGAQVTADETVILPKLPFDISTVSSQIPTDNSFRVGKMKKKSMKSSNLGYATLLTAEVPSKYTEYDSTVRIKEEEVRSEILPDPNVKIKEEEVSAETLPDPRVEIKEEKVSAETLPDPGVKIKKEVSASTLPESKSQTAVRDQSTILAGPSVIKQEYVVQEKTCTETAREVSTLRLYTPVRKSVKDGKDVACCGAIKDMASLATSMTADNSTNTRTPRKRLFTSTTESKEPTLQEAATEMSKDEFVTKKHNKTQTPSRQRSYANDSFADGEKIRSKILCKDCQVRRKLFNSTKNENDPTGSFEPTFTSTKIEEQSPPKKSLHGYSTRETYDSSVTFNKTLPGYFQGLNKCIAELECMTNCLRYASHSKEDVHECIRIFPESDAENFLNNLPHFHTVVDGIPMVVQFNKEAIPIDNSLRSGNVKCCRQKCMGTSMDKASTCCREGGTISKTAHEKCPGWASYKRRKSILKPVQNGKTGYYTKYEKTKSLKGKPPRDREYRKKEESDPPRLTYVALTSILAESSTSIPYVADKTSLPQVDDAEKMCSSLQFDVRTVPVTFNVPLHPDGTVNKALKKVNVLELLDSFRPAKCCRKALLNEKSHGPMPYAASLQSLPLIDGDLRTITKIMQSNLPALTETQTLYEYYINFQKNITPSHNATYGRDFQVYIFDFLKREDDDKSNDPNSSRSSSSNTLHDLRIFEFIKKIYASDQSYDKMSKKHTQSSREDGDSEVKSEKEKKTKRRKSHESCHDKKITSEKRHSSSHRSKHKKTEIKSYYTSVESYSSLKSKSNFFLNSSTSSMTSTKYTKSRDSNSMYSFLLIPKGEFPVSASNYDLSTSYAPSVNSLPFDDELDSVCTSSNNLTRPSSEECAEEWLLSPKNYAKTLDGIYELDEHGNMRVKDSLKNEPSNDKNIADVIKLAIHSRQELPCNSRNLSTIYETDEKSANKESDANIFRMFQTRSRSSNRSKSVSPKSSVIRETSSKSRIPISIRSYSSSAICNERTNKLNSLTKSSTICNRSPLCTNKSSGMSSAANNKLALLPKLSKIPLQTANYVSSTGTYKTPYKTQIQYVNVATSTNDIHKDLVAKVHPSKAFNKPVNAKLNIDCDKPSLELQKALDGTNNFELPITFEIVKPRNNANRNIKFERKVMSFDNESLGSTFGIKDKRNEFKCYRTENVNAWPQLQKKFETSNTALYVSTHHSHHANLEQTKPANFESQIQILQQHPNNKNITYTTTVPTIPQNNNKPKKLSKESFTIVGIASELESKSILKRSSGAHDKTKNSKARKKVKHLNPEVIDIKVSKDIKSTKLKHRFFREGQRPGYVTVLSTPCNCPDIAIFLPCCCGCSNDCDSQKCNFVRQAQQYSMIPIVPKKQQK